MRCQAACGIGVYSPASALTAVLTTTCPLQVFSDTEDDPPVVTSRQVARGGDLQVRPRVVIRKASVTDRLQPYRL